MYYFILTGIVLALLLRRNPLAVLFNIDLKAPFLMIGSFLIQVVLEMIVVQTQQQYPLILSLTFLAMIVALFLNRHIFGVPLIFIGTFLNIVALLLHGGTMPVSESAIQLVGLENQNFNEDSRHQAMLPSVFWWLGDWIPFFTPIGTNYVLSIGDLLIGGGLIVFFVRNSEKKRGIT